MKKTVVIHQPDFLPYLGFFHRLLHADMFVILDDAQYVNGTSQSWMNRDKLKTSQGEKWLTVSVKKAPRETPINQIELSQSDWRESNLNLIRHNYRQAPYFSEIYPHLESLYAYDGNLLFEFNLNSIRMLMGLLDIEIPQVLASTLNATGKKNELLVDILRKVGATQYLSGVGARAYFEPELYERAGIEVVWQDFSHPAYPQLHGPFIPYLSSIDMLFNCGIEESRKIIRSC